MDRFALITGIIGLVLLAIALTIIIWSIIDTIRGRRKITKFIYTLLIFLIISAFAASLIYLSLFLQTFSRYTHEEKIGWVYAEKINEHIILTFFDQKADRMRFAKLGGDQWIIDGYLLRWGLLLRWLGAGSYYQVSRFSGRWLDPKKETTSVYQIHPEQGLWKFLLKYGEKIPFVEAAYGIGAFQYPVGDTVYIYVNDTGFILKKQ